MRAHAENALAVAKYTWRDHHWWRMLYTLVRGEREKEEEQEEEEREKREGGGRGGGEKGGRGEERWKREEHKIFLFQSSVIVIKIGDFKKMNE